jgi:hypothetical protein
MFRVDSKSGSFRIFRGVYKENSSNEITDDSDELKREKEKGEAERRWKEEEERIEREKLAEIERLKNIAKKKEDDEFFWMVVKIIVIVLFLLIIAGALIGWFYCKRVSFATHNMQESNDQVPVNLDEQKRQEPLQPIQGN